MKYRAWVETDQGLKREDNQDFFLLKDDMGLFLVADGMGGHLGGQEASRLAVNIVEQCIRNSSHQEDRRVVLNQAYCEASRIIFEKAEANPKDFQGMGTTLVSAWLQNGKLLLGNVGDSRAYLFSRGMLWQITEDHSLLYEQYRAGLITYEQRIEKKKKNVITRSVGYLSEVELDLVEREPQAGEIYLLCSDGLNGMVKDETIQAILIETPVDRVAKRLVDEAKKNGGDDNITVLVIAFDKRS